MKISNKFRKALLVLVSGKIPIETRTKLTRVTSFSPIIRTCWWRILILQHADSDCSFKLLIVFVILKLLIVPIILKWWWCQISPLFFLKSNLIVILIRFLINFFLHVQNMLYTLQFRAINIIHRFWIHRGVREVLKWPLVAFKGTVSQEKLFSWGLGVLD